MNLTVRINDIEYKDTCVQGVSFSEEYNETLDSGTIRLTHIPKINNLKPYDDVYVYDSAYKFSEYYPLWIQGGDLWDGYYTEEGQVKGLPFYRHLLVDQFTENILSLNGGQIDPTTNKHTPIYSYTIELFSETKRLETVQLPNISVTQPLLIKDTDGTKLKVSIYEYLERFINLYSPKIKVYDNIAQNTWKYANKYKIDLSLESIFGDVYSPDFTLQNPNLRDLLSQLMIVCDRIPYVKDNVIYSKDITERKEKFNIEDVGSEEGLKSKGIVNYISSTLSSDSFCDSVRRQYSDALSQNGKCNFVERLGFRNPNSATMTLEDMKLETTYPIYKINKMYMCYYKPVEHRHKSGNTVTTTTYYFLCKQDITKLVKLDSEWNLLSQDWTQSPTTIDDLAKYKLSTVSYSQGSRQILGWGLKYTQVGSAVISVWTKTHTYIENLFNFMNNHYIYGVYGADYLAGELGITLGATDVLLPLNKVSGTDFHMVVPDGSQGLNKSTQYKGLFFEIEYTSFYSGSLIHSRDLGRDNIIMNDNSSSSLALLEKDGLNQKEKLNRFANKNYLIKSRCGSVLEMKQLGQYTEIDNEDNDVILYKREYSIFDNMITVSYAAMQDYVLKNYFTSVYSKYRTYQLMSYGESVSRSENRKAMFVLSRNKKYKDENTFYTLPTSVFLSAFKPTSNSYDTISDLYSQDNINAAYIHSDKIYAGGVNYSDKEIASDEHTFTSGNSLCFNVAMSDNISGGTGINAFSSEYKTLCNTSFLKLLINDGWEDAGTDDYVIGSTQKWFDIVDNDKTGFMKRIGFYVYHKGSNSQIIFKDISNCKSEYDDLKIKPLFDNRIRERKQLQAAIKSLPGASYSISALDSFLGRPNDSWTNIANCSTLAQHVGEYVSLLFAISDRPGFLGVYILYLNSVDAQNETIYTRNIGWGYYSPGDKYYEWAKGNLGDSYNRFGVEENFYKDNKERIDMTFQLEPVLFDEKEIYFSEWLVRLSDLSSSYNKLENNVYKEYILKSTGYTLTFRFYQILEDTHDKVYLAVEDDAFDDSGSHFTILDLFRIKTFWDLTGTINLRISYEGSSGTVYVASIYYVLENMEKIDDNSFVINGNGTYTDDHSGETVMLANLIFTKDGQYYKHLLDNDSEDASRPAMIEYGNTYDSMVQKLILKKNMFVKVSDKWMDKTIVYKEYPFGTDMNFYLDYQVDEIFSVEEDANGQSYISIDTQKIPVNTKSVQYWFFDNAASYNRVDSEYIYQYTPTTSAYKFVFGVNLRDSDWAIGHPRYIKIYITETTNRDDRVYSLDGRLIGNVHNCIQNGTYTSPTKYEYDANTELSTYTLTVSSYDTVSGGQAYGSGTFMRNDNTYIYAEPASNAEFAYWSDGNTDAKRYITVDNNKNLTAYFNVRNNLTFIQSQVQLNGSYVKISTIIGSKYIINGTVTWRDNEGEYYVESFGPVYLNSDSNFIVSELSNKLELEFIQHSTGTSAGLWAKGRRTSGTYTSIVVNFNSSYVYVLQKCTVNIVLSEHVNGIVLNGITYSTNASVDLAYGTSCSAYAVCDSGYFCKYTQATPLTFTAQIDTTIEFEALASGWYAEQAQLPLHTYLNFSDRYYQLSWRSVNAKAFRIYGYCSALVSAVPFGNAENKIVINPEEHYSSETAMDIIAKPEEGTSTPNGYVVLKAYMSGGELRLWGYGSYDTTVQRVPDSRVILHSYIEGIDGLY